MAKGKTSKAYSRFEQVVLRSHHLVSLHDALSTEFTAEEAETELDFSDLLRAAVVLSVAAMDAYFTDVFAERLVPYLKKRGSNPNLVDRLQKAGLDTAIALELLGMERPYRRIRKLMDGHLARHVTQRLEVIDKLFLA